ncbi:MAG: riboflavin synthase [Deltaproteobacteria bacterium]|nr:riboflavin synthase [Deltaproteobacteria bacterium]
MFTGIIEGVGIVRALKKKEEGAEIEIAADFPLETTNVGDSIAVNGCCLTVTSRLGKSFWADLSPETLAKTTLGEFQINAPVNLERALIVGGRLGGHIVQGHVDGVGKIIKINKLKDVSEVFIEVPEHLLRYVVDKGSVTVDGVSLTVNVVTERSFSVMIVPHTALKTTFLTHKEGDQVNLEMDIIGKYVERLTFLHSDEYAKSSEVTREFLKKHGF